MNGPRLRGFLLKRNAEHRKANLVASKYKRRWVELTGQTLVYAATQQDLLAGKVFALRELKWVKTDGDTKFQIRFPERVLTFKVESGGRTERDTWVDALEQAKQMGVEAGRRGGSAEKLEQLKKIAEEMLLEQSDDGGSRTAAHRASSSSSAGGAAARSHAVAAGPPSISSSRQTETQQQPPSPRSLLASAKAGSMFVTSTFAGTIGHAPTSAEAHSSMYHWRQDSEDDYADNDDANSDRMPTYIRQGSVERAARNCDRDGSGRGTGRGSMQPAAAAAAAAAIDHDISAASGSGTPRSKRRESLQRQPTPGVMLVNTPPPLPTATEMHQLDASPDPTSSVEQLSPAISSHGSPGSSLPARHAQQQQQQQGACSPPLHSPKCQANSACDEILRLEPNELAADSSSDKCSDASSSLAAPATLGSKSSRTVSGVTRPGTAPSYRPGTPLKSCLRGSGSGSSSSNNPPYVGSASSPASSADAAAAAAAAIASLGLQQRKLSALSPLSGKAEEGQQVVSAGHRDGAVKGRDWVEADWDESSDDYAEQGPLHQALQLGRSVDMISCTAAPALGACTPEVPSVVKGVKADNNWLDDDFDS